MTDEDMRKIAEEVSPGEPNDCLNHKLVQHRDGKPPWCNACGRASVPDAATEAIERVRALLDRVEKAEAELGRYDRRLERTENEYNRLETSHSILEAALARVRELHTRDQGYCGACDRLWPCPTIRAFPTIRALEGDK